MSGTGRPAGGRLALALVLLVGGVVLVDLVWSPGESAEHPDGGDGPSSTRPEAGSADEDARNPEFELVPGAPLPPVDGFDGHWLVAGDPSAGRFHLLPLDGGPIVELTTDAPLDGAGSGGSVVTRGVLVTARGGLSLHDGRWFSSSGRNEGGGSDRRVLGVTSTGSSLVVDGDRLVEWWNDDMRRRDEQRSPVIAEGQGEAVGVAGRHVVHQGPSGVFRLDLDSGEVVGLGPGEVRSVGADDVLVRRCDGELRCEHLVVASSDGAVRTAIEPRLDTVLDAARVPLAATGGHRFSPSGERIALVAEGEVAVVDAASGRSLCTVDVPTRPSVERPTVLWAPDSSAGLVVAPHYGEPSGARRPPHVVRFGDCPAEVEVLDAWSVALDATPRGSSWLLHLVDDDLRVDRRVAAP